MKFKHLNVPESWERYWTKYPQGLTILESLFEWVSQVDSMVDNQNKLNGNVEQFREEIDEFVSKFDERLQKDVTTTLEEWQESGFLNVVIAEGLQWEFDDFKATTEQNLISVNQQLNQKVLTVNVREFGATGDGITDDTEAINNAITHVSYHGGGVVVIPNGNFMIKADNTDENTPNYLRQDAGINIKSNVHLRLENGATLRAIPTTEKQYKIVNISGVENVSISGGTIYGERTQHLGFDGEWGYGISVLASKNVKIHDIKIYDCWGDGINLQVGVDHQPNNVPTNVYIDNVISSNNRRQGMSIEAGENVFVRNSVFEKTNGTNPQSGVDIEPFNNDIKVNNVSFINCVFKDNNRSGLVIQQKNVQNIKAISCYFEGNGLYEVLAYDSKGITITNSTLIGDSSNPMGVRMYNVDDGYFTGNNFVDSAFDFGEVRGFRINDNIMRVTGINTEVQPFNNSTMNNTTVTNNIFDYRGAEGSVHHLPLRGRNVVFSGNELISIANGIHVFATNITINNNKLHDCLGIGVIITSKNVRLDSNIFTNVGGVGISVIRILETSENVSIKNSVYYKDSWLTGQNRGLPQEGFVVAVDGCKKVEVLNTEVNPNNAIPLQLPSIEPHREIKIGLLTWSGFEYKYSKRGDILYSTTSSVNAPIICVEEATFDSGGNMVNPPVFKKLTMNP